MGIAVSNGAVSGKDKGAFSCGLKEKKGAFAPFSPFVVCLTGLA